jgi:conjugal transfer pilus assembly protein TraK
MRFLVGIWLLCACLSLTPAQAGPLPVEAVGGVSLPGVPSTLAADAAKAAGAARSGATVATPAASSPDASDGNVAVTVTPGAAEIIRIASGFLNRIITPFENPKLLSVNPIEVQKEGSSLYLAASSDRPIGVHVLSNDADDPRSISLTLIPARIPPRTITLKWPEGAGTAVSLAQSGKAKRWEESAPYEERLLELVKAVAQGQIPDGYSLAERPPTLPCVLPGVRYVTGQRLTGAHFSVFVLRATNISRSTFEIYSHGGCNLRGVVLVAPWPTAYLEPQASTELYVVVANEAFDAPDAARLRPSLLAH